MPWQTDLVLMLRSLIGDLDKSKFTDERLKQILVVGAYNVVKDADFSNTYTVDVAKVSVSPDPITENDTDFNILTVYKSACILLGSEVKTEAANAISIKDGPSSIDLRGVAQSLTMLYNDLCKKYDDLLRTYQYNNTLVGQAVLGPYSPGSMVTGSDGYGRRGNIFN
tara:strand:- start:885 stop:1385 length:501 start_codon:yes stop_codon:yes gene_type:complete